jgi:mannose/fructose/N-acetylgalactosamine-specific phosphotransferase system component IIC
VGLVGIILTVLYSELEADEAAEQETPEQQEAPEEGAQEAAREDLAGP